MEYNFTLADLFKAYYDCRKHKRNKHSALQFELDLETNLLELYKEIKSGNYKIGRSICFVVTKPKPREVWAANFRDRIVHHLIYNFIFPRFYKRFIHDTYICIPKRGTLHAAKRLLHFARSASLNYKKPVYYLKADLANFFVSIDKNILFNLLKKYVDEDWILEILKRIIFHNPANNVYKKSPPALFKLIPPYKSLFNADKNYGLPIGNLTSQFFSNVYLDILDKYVKENLKCKDYIRYVDDFIILADNTKFLNECHKKIGRYISKTLQLTIHPHKKLINNVKHGMLFLGFNIKPHRISLYKITINRIKSIVQKWKMIHNRFSSDILYKFFKTLNSYFGMFANISGFDVRFFIGTEINSLFIYPSLNFKKLVLCC